MTADALEGLEGQEELQAAARSRAFGLFAAAIEYPEGGLLEDIRGGRLAEALAEALGALDPGLVEEIDWDALRDGGEGEELAIEFTRLFDVGVSGPPCSLYGGVYGGSRMKTMEEAVRFYNHFGLSLAEKPRELPDHLTTQLEFLHYLAFRETEALQAGSDAGSYRRAQRDFIERHPGRWVPKLRARLEEEDAPRFFLELVRGLERLLGRTRAELAEGSR
jgi:DMSO reductase family type II enzyme chaperone